MLNYQRVRDPHFGVELSILIIQKPKGVRWPCGWCGYWPRKAIDGHDLTDEEYDDKDSRVFPG